MPDGIQPIKTQILEKSYITFILPNSEFILRFRMGYTSPVIFKMKLFLTIVKQSSPISLFLA